MYIENLKENLVRNDILSKMTLNYNDICAFTIHCIYILFVSLKTFFYQHYIFIEILIHVQADRLTKPHIWEPP